MAYLELIGLEKRFESTIAVRDVTLQVERGEFVSLLGPSGCGKTTTLRMVAGFVEPSAGTILLAGKAIERVPAHKRHFGFVFQSYALFPHLTVAGNVGFGLRMRHVARDMARERIARALALVGLDRLAERYPSQLSGGQQQRVALARALVIEPDLLLLDEPLSNLDAALRAEMREEIRALQRRLKITTLFVTHDQDEALALSDRIVVMDHGAMIEQASPRDLSEHPRRAFTAGFLGARTVLPGRIEGGRFVTRAGLAIELPDGAPADADHLVLRAARLRLDGAPAPIMLEARIESVTYQGDVAHVVALAGPERIRVIVPSTEREPQPGAATRLCADAGAIAWLSEASFDNQRRH